MPSKPIAFIEHDPKSPVGTLSGWLIEAGYDCVVFRAYDGDPIPRDPADYLATVIMGGGQSARSDEDFAWRADTLELIRKAAAAQHPTLGICLGSQLIAQALGGVVERGSEGLEVGPMLAGRKDVSYHDELFQTLPMAPDVIEFHGEVVAQLPPGAVHLMSGPVYEHQAFRVGERMWGTQFHFETTHAIFEQWMADNREALVRKGFDVDTLLHRSAIVHPELREVWEPFMVRFAEIASGIAHD